MPLDNIIKTILAEAAGEGEQGMYMVGSSIVNRAQRRRQTPQQVVDAPSQYSGRWRRDLDAFVAQQPPAVIAQAEQAWQRAQQSPMPGVDHYLTTELFQSGKAPSWSRQMQSIGTVGQHTIFDSQRRPGGQTMVPPMTNNPQRIAMGGQAPPMMGGMMGVAPPGRGVGMAPRPQSGQPQSLKDKLFAMDQSVQAAGMQPLSNEELRQLAQQMMGGGQQPPQSMLGQAPPPQGNPMMAGGLMRQGMS